MQKLQSLMSGAALAMMDKFLTHAIEASPGHHDGPGALNGCRDTGRKRDHYHKRRRRIGGAPGAPVFETVYENIPVRVLTHRRKGKSYAGHGINARKIAAQGGR